MTCEVSKLTYNLTNDDPRPMSKVIPIGLLPKRGKPARDHKTLGTVRDGEYVDPDKTAQ